MPSPGQQLTQTYLEMLDTHDPDLVDRFVAVDYVNHNPFGADGREADRRPPTSMY
jgi:predicted SnoaL-like aldol condensation-catalyzing enzyme